MPLRPLMAVLVTIMFSVAACADEVAETLPDYSPRPDVAKVLVLRAETLELANQLFKTEERISRNCMQRLGFIIHPVPSDEVIADRFPYPATPVVEVAKRVGYFSEANSSQSTAPDPFGQLTRPEQQRYDLALNGSGEGEQIVLEDGSRLGLVAGGCRGQTVASLYGDVKQFVIQSHVISSAAERARALTDDDPRVKQVLSRWAKCMREAKFKEVATPEQAREIASSLLRPGVPPAEAASRSIPIAVAHAKCSEEVPLDRARHAVWSEHLGEDLLRHESQILALRDLQKSALEKAAQ